MNLDEAKEWEAELKEKWRWWSFRVVSLEDSPRFYVEARNRVSGLVRNLWNEDDEILHWTRFEPAHINDVERAVMYLAKTFEEQGEAVQALVTFAREARDEMVRLRNRVAMLEKKTGAQPPKSDIGEAPLFETGKGVDDGDAETKKTE